MPSCEICCACSAPALRRSSCCAAERLKSPAADGAPGIERITETYPRPLDDATVGGQAMLTKQVVQYSPVVGNRRVPKAAQQIARDCGYNSIIAAPMICQGKVIGAIVCATASRGSSPTKKSR